MNILKAFVVKALVEWVLICLGITVLAVACTPHKPSESYSQVRANVDVYEQLRRLK
jgi:hypothetical protein